MTTLMEYKALDQKILSLSENIVIETISSQE